MITLIDNVQYVTYYHGTTCATIEHGDELEMRGAANGFGLYLTRNIELAQQYGRVVEMLLPFTFDFDKYLQEEVNGVKGLASVITNNRSYVEFVRTVVCPSEL